MILVYLSHQYGSNSGGHIYIPPANLYCDEDGYISLKEKPSGTCIYGGKQVNVGNWTVFDEYSAPLIIFSEWKKKTSFILW